MVASPLPRPAQGHMREVLTGASIAFVLRIIGAGAAFLLNVAIARLLGAEGAGLYFLALSVVLMASVLAQLGMGNTLLRFISVGATKGDGGQVKGVFRQALTLAAIASALLALLIAATAGWSATALFAKPALATPLRVAALAIMPFTLMTLLSESLKGLKRIGYAMLVASVIYPIVALLLIWPLASMGAAGAALTYGLGTLAAAGAGAVFWRHAVRSYGPPRSFPSRQLWQSARPLLVMNIIVRGMIPLLPVLLVGIWGSAEDAGIFGAATRLALLASFFLAALNTAIAPKFSELYVQGDIATLARLTRRFALGMTLATSPIFLGLLLAGDRVMALFGPDFSRGGTALAILAAGQLGSTLLGSTGFILIMSGHERDTRNAAFFAAAILGLLCALAIPAYGIIGAALASAGAVIGLNAYTAAMANKRLKLGLFALRGGL